MTTVNELDLKGSIPEFVLRTTFKDQGYIIERLRRVLPKWKAKYPDDTLDPDLITYKWRLY